ncbi:MAG: hypothetical protein Q9167_003515 [Letrouitia subvulpina]
MPSEEDDVKFRTIDEIYEESRLEESDYVSHEPQLLPYSNKDQSSEVRWEQFKSLQRKYGPSKLSGTHEPFPTLQKDSSKEVGSWADKCANTEQVSFIDDLNCRDRYGHSALTYAVTSHEEVLVMQILKRDNVRLDFKCSTGETPLQLAVKYRNVTIVKLLLQREQIETNCRDRFGNTPLCTAAKLGNGAVVELLLQRDDVEANARDKYGRTPLHLAASSRNETTVKLLLQRDDVEVNTSDVYSQTPLHIAVIYKREAIVKLLLQRDDVQVNSRNKHDETPLHLAVIYKREAIVKLLLQRDDVQVNSRNKHDGTPLHLAASSRKEAIVKLFLQRDDIQPSSRDKYGYSPLFYAVLSANLAAIELLLQREDIQADSKDNTDRTPLSHAAALGFEEVVKRLLSYNVQADSSDECGRTPLSYAVSLGHEKIAERLLQYNVQPESKDKNGRTPLSHAAEWGNESLVKLLLEQNGVEADSKDINSWTPLAYAIDSGREAVVWFLLQRIVPTNPHDSNLPPTFLRAIIGEGVTVPELILQSDRRRAAVMAYHEKGQKGQKASSLSRNWMSASEPYDEGGGTLTAIRSEIKESPDHGYRNRVTFVVDWELSDCMSKQYEGSIQLGHLLILVGSARKAYATKCSEYLKLNWPKTWEICLAAVEETLRSTENLSVIYSQSKISIIITRAADSPLVMQLMGSSEAILEVAQQLVFIAATFRLSSTRLSLSDCFLESESIEVFRLGLAPLEAVPYENSMCWHPLFTGSIIVRGFPMPPRADGVGIELPYSVMLALARILYPVEFAGGILLKGFDTMLVPTACSNSSIQWHFIQEESSNNLLASYVRGESTGGRRPKRLPTWAIEDYVQSWVRLTRLDDILDKRMFLGFCDKVNIHLGTEGAEYHSVGYSRSSSRSGTSFEIIGGTTSFAFASNNLPGPALAVNFGFSRYQAAVRNFINVSFVELLHRLKNIPVILYDDDREVRKAWLVSALSAVLHMAHIWAARSPELTHIAKQRPQIPFAKAAFDGGQAALDALLTNDNCLLELHAVPGAEPYRLKDLIHRIWGNMESAIEVLEMQKPSGIRFERTRTLRGWQFMDMVQCQALHRPREHRIERSGMAWFSLAKDVMVLFCSRIGDIIQPNTGAQTCRSWWPIPSKKDYMVASLRCLGHSLDTRDSRFQGLTAMADGLYWNASLLLNLDHECSEAENDQCNILQEIARRPAQNDYSHGKLKEEFLSRYFREGAVILGRKSRFKEFSGALSPRRRRHAVPGSTELEKNEKKSNIDGTLVILKKNPCRTNAQEGESTPFTAQDPNTMPSDTGNAPGLAPQGVTT